jgi:hypothetical protein
VEVDAELHITGKTHSELAMTYFKQGHNCSQSVFIAFCDEYGMDFEMALKISISMKKIYDELE